MEAALAVVFAVLTVLHMAYYPLSVLFEARARSRPATRYLDSPSPLVSVIIPAYNERLVIAACLDSVLADRYQNKEIIVIDDGSTDGTLAVLDRYRHRPGVTVLAQANGGKASALNAGIALANGEIMVFADADGVFAADTIDRLLDGFDRPDVGAVCGNDTPSNLDSALPRLLALLTHVTSLVRRALSVVNCLSIVSGNCGALRSRVVREVGGFTEGMVGEDLEITWRVHRAGYRVTFQPRAMVRAEVPSTVGALWKQRVRWTRGLIQTARMHRDMLCRPRYGAVSYYITLNLITTLLLAPLQLAFLAVLIGTTSLGDIAGLVVSLTITLALVDFCLAAGLDRAWRDLRFLYLIPGMLLYSTVLSAVVLWAWLHELRGTPAHWNKLARRANVPR
ncbi:glycosyltransferase [Allorhizocola rhizosphaerae]|uniref:glycosyltransferase n=1 Tax=Allorhizocola rhizosphaerae TaxID=1872709 RepID=UPI000E3E3AF1|nr:glycosyltransferase family 2 protein [Allorhizocola rhizosphaerae]